MIRADSSPLTGSVSTSPFNLAVSPPQKKSACGRLFSCSPLPNECKLWHVIKKIFAVIGTAFAKLFEYITTGLAAVISFAITAIGALIVLPFHAISLLFRAVVTPSTIRHHRIGSPDKILDSKTLMAHLQPLSHYKRHVDTLEIIHAENTTPLTLPATLADHLEQIKPKKLIFAGCSPDEELEKKLRILDYSCEQIAATETHGSKLAYTQLKRVAKADVCVNKAEEFDEKMETLLKKKEWITEVSIVGPKEEPLLSLNQETLIDKLKQLNVRSLVLLRTQIEGDFNTFIGLCKENKITLHVL